MVYYCKTAYADLEFIVLKEVPFSYPKHCHISSYTLGIVLNGKISLEFDQKHFTCNVGDTFLISPYEMHTVLCSDTYDMLVISLKKTFLNDNTYDETYSKISHYMKVLVDENFIDTQNSKILLDRVNVLYDTHICKDSNDTFSAVKEFLESYPEEPIDLEHLSRFSAMSKYHFIRKFDENIGMTPHKFQIQNRVRKAKVSLEETDSLTQAGVNAGFYDQSHFIRHFKHLYKMTPSDYKAACIDLDDLAKSREKLR